MKNIILLTCFLLLFKTSFSQDVKGDIEIYLNNIIDDMPGSSGNDYQVPTTDNLNTWADVLGYLFNNQLESAKGLIGSLNYQIVDFQDTTLNSNNDFFIIEEKKPKSNYWGTYVISKDPSLNKLVIQAPHPKYDSNTGYQAIFCFKRLQPKALFISGTHRCNHTSKSDCSGTTSACGSSSPYRVSDNAHNTNSIFQETTEELFVNFASTVFVQLHGFGKKSDDPYVIMSNGTRTTPAIDYNTLIKHGLKQADASLTFKIANINTGWDRLIAFTNVQGRYINNSSNACTENASSSEGRFVHIEQERSKLRADSLGWHKMYLALKIAFDGTTDIVPLDNNYNRVRIFPNPNNGYFRVNLIGKADITIWNSQGLCIYNNMNTEEPSLNIELKNQESGIYIIRIGYKNGVYQEKLLVIK